MNVVAGVDIGGTKIAAGLVTETGELLRSTTRPTPAKDGPAAVLAAVVAAVTELDSPLVAAGVGSAGVIDAASGRVLSATDALPGWPGTDLRGELRSLLGVPVAVDNDVHAHAVGEVWRGAAVGRRYVLFVAVGTGVGASLLVDGAAYHGARSVAGHAGHLPVPAAAGKSCTCNGSGHAEAVASGPALLAEYRRRSGADVGGLSAVSALAERGDPVAAAVLHDGAVALGQAVGGLVNVLDPDVVLLGGGVSNCGDAWWRPLRSTVAAEVLPPLASVPLTAAALGGDAAMIGAARLGWEALW